MRLSLIIKAVLALLLWVAVAPRSCAAAAVSASAPLQLLSAQVMLPHRHASFFGIPATDPIFEDFKDYWRLDEASSPWVDSAGTNNLYLTTYAWTNGLLGYAYHMTADNPPWSSGWLLAPDSPELSGTNASFSVTAWVYPNVLGTLQDYLGKWDGNGVNATNFEWLFQQTGGGSAQRLQWYVSNGTNTAGSASSTVNQFIANRWNFLTGVMDNSTHTAKVILNNDTANQYSWSWTNGTWNSALPLRIGFNEFRRPPSSIDEVGFWKKALSAAEVTALYNGGSGLAYPFAGTPSLVTNLVSYWTLNETNGVCADSVGTNILTLTCSNALASTTGIITNGVNPGPSSYTLYAPDSPDLSEGTNAFTLTAWFKLVNWVDSNSGRLMGKCSPWTNEYHLNSGYEWIFDAGGTNGTAPKQAEFRVSNGTTSQEVYAGDILATNTWYFAVARHNPTNMTISIQINTNTVYSTNWAGGSWDSTWPLFVTGAEGCSVAGIIDELGFWKRVLTTNESARIYTNTLAGHGYPYW